ncbi:vgr related protein [Allosphingosinicella vermicomposti]|uniref:vgr related protein n=1 Tax=Allosphingosinicella vermicomposti TaxID=614671 RepID=UPI000D0F6F89|nr:vgr related protein [Allosphingosinicella vermicomposti]
MTSRPLTLGEIALARTIFGDTIDYTCVTIRRRKWFPFQPRNTVMAPCGHIHIHPHSDLWQDDYSLAPLPAQGLFIHEMTHVWQTQQRGRFYLPLMRHPFCRYRYTLQPGWPLTRYGLEQQAEIIRHAFLRRQGYPLANAPTLGELEPLVRSASLPA